MNDFEQMTIWWWSCQGDYSCEDCVDVPEYNVDEPTQHDYCDCSKQIFEALGKIEYRNHEENSEGSTSRLVEIDPGVFNMTENDIQVSWQDDVDLTKAVTVTIDDIATLAGVSAGEDVQSVSLSTMTVTVPPGKRLTVVVTIEAESTVHSAEKFLTFTVPGAPISGDESDEFSQGREEGAWVSEESVVDVLAMLEDI